MNRYYGWIGEHGYDSVVKITDAFDAHVFNREKKDFIKNNYYLKARYDPGSEFEEISEEEALELIKGWKK